jgi:hypothetical protein
MSKTPTYPAGYPSAIVQGGGVMSLSADTVAFAPSPVVMGVGENKGLRTTRAAADMAKTTMAF